MSSWIFIGRVNFSEQDRQELLIIAKRVFIDIPNRKHAKQMMGVLRIENMRSILEERESLPELDEHNALRLKFEDLNGSYLTPGFRDPNYDGDFYSRNHFLQIFLEIPRHVLMQNNLLGGKRNRQSGTWNWLDGRLWDFENWYTKSFYLNPFESDTQPSNKIGEDCIACSSVWGW